MSRPERATPVARFFPPEGEHLCQSLEARRALMASVHLLIPMVLLGAQEFAPGFYNLSATSENSSLSMKCTGAPPFNTIDCDFVYTTVSVPGEDRVKEKLEETKRHAEEALDDPRRKSICKDVQQAPAVDPGWTREQRAAMEATIQATAALCRCPDQVCARAALLKLAEEDARTCQIHTQHSRATLRSAGEQRWTGATRIDGPCDLTSSYTVERSPKDKHAWKVTWERSYADRLGPCETLRPEPTIVFRWDVPDEMLVRCSRLSFGWR
jgi:hypothetical protein